MGVRGFEVEGGTQSTAGEKPESKAQGAGRRARERGSGII